MKSFLILSLLFSVNAFSNVTINTITNASSTGQLGTKYIPEVWAGISGSAKCSGQTTTINTCAIGNDRSACNFKTVCASTQLTMNLKSDTSGKLLLVDSEDTLVRDLGSYTAGQNITVSIPWGEICNVVSQDGSCSRANGRSTLKIGVDNNADGVLEDSTAVRFEVSKINNTTSDSSISDGTDGVNDYTLVPGNKKAFVTDFTVVQDFYVYDAAKIVGIRGFFAKSDCSNPLSVTTASDSYLLDLNADKEIIDTKIEGLQNGTRYLFMFGFQDEAGNIGLFKDLTQSCSDDHNSVMPH
jgi:hypothetical protein